MGGPQVSRHRSLPILTLLASNLLASHVGLCSGSETGRQGFAGSIGPPGPALSYSGRKTGWRKNDVSRPQGHLRMTGAKRTPSTAQP